MIEVGDLVRASNEYLRLLGRPSIKGRRHKYKRAGRVKNKILKVVSLKPEKYNHDLKYWDQIAVLDGTYGNFKTNEISVRWLRLYRKKAIMEKANN
jgi:N-glycosylase/DNA lyase